LNNVKDLALISVINVFSSSRLYLLSKEIISKHFAP